MSNFENVSSGASVNSKIKTPKAPKEPKSPKEPKAPKEPKSPKEPKAPKEPKEPKIKKEPKEPKVKAQKEPKVKKDTKEPKLKEVKTPKEPKVKALKTKSNSIPVLVANNAKTATECTPVVLKKRGRKPKGGKIISSTTMSFTHSSDGPNSGTINDSDNNNKHMVPKQPFVSANVILHLKCNYSDLLVNSSMSSFKYEPVVEDVESYTNCGDLSETAGAFTQATSAGGIYADEVKSIIDGDGADYNTIGNIGNNIGNNDCDDTASNHHHAFSSTTTSSSVCMFPMPHSSVQQSASISCVPIKSPYIISSTIMTTSSAETSNNSNHGAANSAHTAADTDVEMKEVWRKINRLKLVLHKDNARFNSTQQSGCFWCTCEFDTPVIHIPKLYTKTTDSYTVYGCFCSPECATSYLMKESIDTSTRFERYQMLNVMYNNICNNTDKPIKPAPDPHYLLSKFYGNLSIEEYRKLLKSDHLLYIVNKPLTHSLPELYEDNNEFLVNNKTTIPNAMSKTKKR
jgi:hypothetical protein